MRNEECFELVTFVQRNCSEKCTDNFSAFFFSLNQLYKTSVLDGRVAVLCGHNDIPEKTDCGRTRRRENRRCQLCVLSLKVRDFKEPLMRLSEITEK